MLPVLALGPETVMGIKTRNNAVSGPSKNKRKKALKGNLITECFFGTFGVLKAIPIVVVFGKSGLPEFV